MTVDYNDIAHGYGDTRREDPQVAAQIWAHLGNAHTILNVGAGKGSYEPQDRSVISIEPSWNMIKKHRSLNGFQVQGCAEYLPFADNSFDAVMGVLTIHHWSSPHKGLQEMLRVSRDVVVLLTFDPAIQTCWLLKYFPQLAELDAQIMPLLDIYSSVWGDVDIYPLMVPSHCQDGFLYAFWARPEAYLNEAVRSSMSSFRQIDDVENGLYRLKSDLESGKWHEDQDHLLKRESLDVGYRLVIGRNLATK